MTDVAIAHDYLTQSGGAERVVVELTRHWPDAPVYTSLYDPGATFSHFRDVDVRTSRLQRLGILRQDPRRALPFLAREWQNMRAENCDVVIASTSGWSHGISVDPGVRKIAYCHNPPRWLYQDEIYNTTLVTKLAMRSLGGYLTRRDQAAARSVDHYIANSTSVANRIKLAYGITPSIVFPPVMVSADDTQEQVPGIEPGYWLTVGRPRGYKNTDKVVEAFTRCPAERLVTVGSRAEEWPRPPHNIRHTGFVTEERLRWLYANARALITVSHEDYGLTPLEANIFGTPVLALKEGGHLDTVSPEKSGSWIYSTNVDEIISAVERFGDFDERVVAAHGRGFSVSKFVAQIDRIVGDVVEEMCF